MHLVDESETVEILSFTIEGVAAPQGSKSLMRGRLVEANPRTRLWRAAVQDAAERALAGREGFGKDPVHIRLDFHMPRPRTVKRARPSVPPDVDKLSRAVLDSITKSGVWKDDGQVVDLSAHKHYAEKPCIVVTIRRAA
jgi:Holliday junction resolvase RusA-like endonuclease